MRGMHISSLGCDFFRGVKTAGDIRELQGKIYTSANECRLFS